MSESLEARRWNNLYKEGRYEDDPPIPFVDKILEELGEAGKEQAGLYIGCGNGRNYIPLLDEGLNLHGIDISSEGIRQIEEARPEAKVLTREITDLHQADIWDYLIAIQVFQHGNKETVNNMFSKAQQILKPNGKLFLRVNSVNTEPYYKQKRIEGNKGYGYTVVYEEGPKKDTEVHFFSLRELGSVATKHFFNVLVPPYQVNEERKPPQTGTWTQWETIWQKA
jgi:SAM-dependent methyltransferase